MPVMDFGDALNLALREEMRRDPRVYCIGEDIVLGIPFGVTKGLIDEFGPERVLNAPISEAAIVGSAMGAAMTGLVPVVDMHFADFVTSTKSPLPEQPDRQRGGGVSRPGLTSTAKWHRWSLDDAAVLSAHERLEDAT